MAENILLIVALRDDEPIASALNFMNREALYGRSWGTLEFHSGLHFEACYYQAIEFCIEHRIALFEGGAQGEHKLSRGFLPTSPGRRTGWPSRASRMRWKTICAGRAAGSRVMSTN